MKETQAYDVNKLGVVAIGGEKWVKPDVCHPIGTLAQLF